jgi:hypothetical protein
LRIVLASPSDVKGERDSVAGVVAKVNNILTMAGRDLRFEVARWETDAYPALHPAGPQGIIDDVLRIEDCHVLVVIFWKRFGTAVRDAASGTEHEIRIAFESWQQRRRPQLMLYFNQKAYTPKLPEDTDQWVESCS